MRFPLQTWLLRLLALTLFVSGGALARAVAQEIETHFAPIEHRHQDPEVKAVTLEVRQPVPVQLESAVANSRAMSLELQVQVESIVMQFNVLCVAVVLRSFDALAPPQRL